MVTRELRHARNNPVGQSYPLQSHPLENVDDDVDCCLEEDAVCRICWGEREDSEGVFFVTFQSPMSIVCCSVGFFREFHLLQDIMIYNV